MRNSCWYASCGTISRHICRVLSSGARVSHVWVIKWSIIRFSDSLRVLGEIVVVRVEERLVSGNCSCSSD
jgi:hypothetical protein